MKEMSAHGCLIPIRIFPTKNSRKSVPDAQSSSSGDALVLNLSQTDGIASEASERSTWNSLGKPTESVAADWTSFLIGFELQHRGMFALMCVNFEGDSVPPVVDEAMSCPNKLSTRFVIPFDRDQRELFLRSFDALYEASRHRCSCLDMVRDATEEDLIDDNSQEGTTLFTRFLAFFV